MFSLLHSHSRRTRRGDSGLTLVEALVAMGIGLIVTGILVLSWFSLSRSYSMTSKGTQAGEKARDAVSRLSREIRDAEPDPTDGYPAIIDFGDTFVEFTTTFNQSGNDQPLPTPILTRYEYRLDTDSLDPNEPQTLHRLRDSDGDGVLEEGERDDLVVTDLKNYTLTADGWELTTSPFEYLRLDPETRNPVQATPATPSKFIALVRVHLLVQLPGKGPRATDLASTVQLRNQAQ